MKTPRCLLLVACTAAFVMYQVWNWYHERGIIALSIVDGLFSVAVMVTFLASSLMNPGFIPKQSTGNDDLDKVSIGDGCTYIEVGYNGFLVRRNYCSTC